MVATVKPTMREELERARESSGGSWPVEFAVDVPPRMAPPGDAPPARRPETPGSAEGGRKGKGGDAARACLRMVELARTFQGQGA